MAASCSLSAPRIDVIARAVPSRQDLRRRCIEQGQNTGRHRTQKYYPLYQFNRVKALKGS
eukprot:scaffold10803_cov51-Phaeocystis_antarctica.AAC.3